MSLRLFFRSLIISLIIGFLAYWVSGPTFFTPRFEAEALIFPALLQMEEQAEHNGTSLGGEADLQTHLTVLQSESLRDTLRYYLKRKGLSNKNIKPIVQSLQSEATENGAIQVSARATSRRLAAEVVDAAIDLTDRLKDEMLRPNRVQSYTYTRGLYFGQLRDVEELQRELDSLRIYQDTVSNEALRQGKRSELYQKEAIYRSAVAELARYRKRKEKLARTQDAGVPDAYRVSTAGYHQDPVWPPRMLISLTTIAISFTLLVLLKKR